MSPVCIKYKMNDNTPYLLMGEPVRPAHGPYAPSTKIMYKSLFPTSNVNSECIFGFYAKFYVGICLVRFLSFIFFADAAATKKLHRKNGTFFLIILIISSIKRWQTYNNH